MNRCNRIKICDLSEEQQFERLKKSYEKRVVRRDGCWGWSGYVNKGGYPRLTIHRKPLTDKGHIASWIIHKSKVPSGMQIFHKCGNKICTNPDHLRVGSKINNFFIYKEYNH
jgi:hypothetical protein